VRQATEGEFSERRWKEEEKMRTWQKAALLTVTIAIPAFILGPVIWPMSPDFPALTGVQFGLFAGLAAWEALLLGAGVSFLVFGWSAARQSPQPGKATVALVAVTWLMSNWWVHDNLHAHTGMNVPGLLAIEYGFHFTLGATGLVLAYLFVDAMRGRFPIWPGSFSRHRADRGEFAEGGARR
jgi:hypothetical protein